MPELCLVLSTCAQPMKPALTTGLTFLFSLTFPSASDRLPWRTNCIRANVNPQREKKCQNQIEKSTDQTERKATFYLIESSTRSFSLFRPPPWHNGNFFSALRIRVSSWRGEREFLKLVESSGWAAAKTSTDFIFSVRNSADDLVVAPRFVVDAVAYFAEIQKRFSNFYLILENFPVSTAIALPPNHRRDISLVAKNV